MPTGQQYGTGVPQATLTAGIGAATTNFGLNSLSGWPATPFTATFDIGTSSQEVIDVLAVSGNTVTSCTRGLDGTVAQSHALNATFTHTDIGRDFREARAHLDASGPTDTQSHSVHGLTTGTVVGTSESQTLTNKTIGSAVFTGTQAMGSGTWSGSGALAETTLSTTGLTGAANTSRLAGATTAGGPPTSGSFTTGDIVEDQLFGTLWICTASGSPGTWVPVAGEVNVAEVVLGAPSASMTASIPSWAKTFRVNWSGRSAGGVTNVMVQFNGDTGSNYLWQEIQAEGAGSSSSNSGGTTSSIQIGVAPGSGSTANYFGSGDFVVSNSAGSVFKTAVGKSVALNTATDTFIGIYGGQWNNTAAITSILLKNGTGNFVTGSTMTVYAGT